MLHGKTALVTGGSRGIGRAVARVIEQTTRKALPKGFQTAEFVLQHGFLDGIAPRSSQKNLLAFLLSVHGGKS